MSAPEPIPLTSMRCWLTRPFHLFSWVVYLYTSVFFLTHFPFSGILIHPKGFPDGSVVKNLLANTGDPRDADSIPGVRKIPWRREWQPTPVFLPGKSHGQRSLVGYSPWCHRVRHNWATEHIMRFAHDYLFNDISVSLMKIIVFPIFVLCK